MFQRQVPLSSNTSIIEGPCHLQNLTETDSHLLAPNNTSAYSHRQEALE